VLGPRGVREHDALQRQLAAHAGQRGAAVRRGHGLPPLDDVQQAPHGRAAALEVHRLRQRWARSRGCRESTCLSRAALHCMVHLVNTL